MTDSSTRNGFTLIELAMAMVVIGLVMGGLLMGQNFLENARMNATVADFKMVRAAHFLFQDKYRAVPGDMLDATARLAGCTAALNCLNGDGSGTVGTRIDNVQTIAASPGVQENIQYWKHLALADMISGVESGAPATAAASAYGVSHPVARIGGGWNAIMTDPAGLGDYGGKGLVLQLTGAPNLNTPIVPPRMARQMDEKIDDGRPNTGLVTAEGADDSLCDDDTDNSYRADATSSDCVVYFAAQ